MLRNQSIQIDRAYNQSIPKCIEVKDKEAEVNESYLLNSSGKANKAVLSEEIRQQKAKNHYSRSTADDSDIEVRDL